MSAGGRVRRELQRSGQLPPGVAAPGGGGRSGRQELVAPATPPGWAGLGRLRLMFRCLGNPGGALGASRARSSWHPPSFSPSFRPVGLALCRAGLPRGEQSGPSLGEPGEVSSQCHPSLSGASRRHAHLALEGELGRALLPREADLSSAPCRPGLRLTSRLSGPPSPHLCGGQGRPHRMPPRAAVAKCSLGAGSRCRPARPSEGAREQPARPPPLGWPRSLAFLGL